MIKPVDKIVIVGGGSAGWITAAAIIKAYPNKDLTVIESADVPTVGVGESTLGHFRRFCNFLEIDEKDFMTHCDASYKLSIQFTDFYEKGAGSFHYPFGQPFLKDTVDGMQDWLLKKAMFPETPIRDFVHCYFPAAALFETNKYSLNKFNEFDNFDPKNDVAYHFDAIKFATWLRERYCKPRGVKHIQATVTDIKVNDDIGIEKLVLNTGDEISAHLFVDCTGFRSLLIGQALKQEFYSYNHILPNNRAWACQVPYKNKEKELQGYTNCTAIQNGWVWNTPIWTRIGTGYVYSDKYVDPEIAKEEFKQYLMSDKMVIPRTRDDVESLNFRDVPMRVGAYKNGFVKNVVAIGLSAGFIEPLESNGLLTVHEWALHLLRLLQRPAINEYDKETYNKKTFDQWRGFADFVALHYSLSIRNDTEYWKSNFNRPLVRLSDNPYSSTERLIENKFITNRGRDNVDGMNWISVGMHWFFFDEINMMLREKVIGFSRQNYDHMKQMEEHFHLFEERKRKWRKHAANAPSLYYYQKKYIYGEE
jgi:tryptophan halogenase